MRPNSKDIINASVLCLEWLTILGLIYINQNYHSLPLQVASIILIGTRIHALGILMHEASHFNLFSNRSMNDWITKIFITSPFLISLDSYRRSHMAHHQYSLTAKDPTHTRKNAIKIFQFPKKSNLYFMRELLSLSLGYGMYLNFKDLSRNLSDERNVTSPKSRSKAKLKLKPKPALNVVMGLTLIVSLLISPVRNIVLLYWILPTLTIVPALNYWRTISEHSNLGAYKEPTRTVIYSPLLQWLLTPYNVNYHLEHHLFPKKSWYHLRKLTLQEKEKLKSGHVTYGFLKLWNEFVR